MYIKTLVKTIFTMMIICWGTQLQAQTEDSCFAKAPAEVGVGQQFKYIISSTGRGEVVSTDFGKFEFVSGPSVGSSTSISINNGSVQQQTTYTYTYYLSAPKEGNFTIPGVSLSINGRIYRSNMVEVRVTKTPKSQPQEEQQADNWFHFEWPDFQMPDMDSFSFEWPFQNQQRPKFPNEQQPKSQPDKSSKAPAKIGKEDMMLKAITTTLEAYQGEAVVVTHKLYVKEDISGYSIERASFGGSNDLWMDPLELSRQEKSTETVNGKTYTVFTIKQTAVYPTKTGKIVIPKLNVILAIRVPATSRDPFWGMFQTYQTQTVQLTSNELTVKVKALPGARNDGKTEVVGNFNITSNISKTDAYANEPITFTVTVSGNGNLHHVSNEDFNIDFPADCDVTYPKVISHISAKGDIVSGTKTFRFTIIPRMEGSYLIPGVKYTYYDYDSGSYKTLTTQDYQLEIQPARTRENPYNDTESKPKSKVKTYKI